jgi:hypothetical protein
MAASNPSMVSTTWSANLTITSHRSGLMRDVDVGFLSQSHRYSQFEEGTLPSWVDEHDGIRTKQMMLVIPEHMVSGVAIQSLEEGVALRPLVVAPLLIRMLAGREPVIEHVIPEVAPKCFGYGRHVLVAQRPYDVELWGEHYKDASRRETVTVE